MKIQKEVEEEEGLEMARKERGEFVFSAFSSFLLAWPVRRLVMHDRCRYMYSAGCTRSGAKHRWKSPLCLPSIPPSALFLHPHFIHEEEEGFVSHSFPDLWKVRAREIQKIGQSDRFPANVPQMNDHLESHKPFFSATENPWVKRWKNFETDSCGFSISCWTKETCLLNSSVI